MEQKETKTDEKLLETAEITQESEEELEEGDFIELDSEDDDSDLPAHMFQRGDKWQGNKTGRPKGVRNTKTLFREAFEAIASSGNITDPEKDLFITLLAKAQKGDMKAMRMFLEYRFGKPTQSVELKADVKTDNGQLEAMEDMIAKVIAAKQESQE